jgi:hypothetical protein
MTVMQWTDEEDAVPDSKTVLQKSDDLGERTIQGILTRGCRVSTFIPTGAIHNDQPLTVTDDSWTSYDMRLTLLKLHQDPSQAGKCEAPEFLDREVC